MAKTIRYTLLSIRELLASAGPFVLLAIGLLWLAYWWLDPNPPKQVRLGTGPAQSAYDEFGKRYAKALAVQGIQVQLVPSQGSSDNLLLLRDNKVDLAFVQGGSVNPPAEGETPADTGMESLGSLFLEPVWLFYREDSARKLLDAAKEKARAAEQAANEAAAQALAQAQAATKATMKATAKASTKASGKPTPKAVLKAANPAAPPPPASASSKPDKGGDNGATLTSLTQLQGLRVNVGTAGSGVPSLMAQLLDVNRVDAKNITLSQLEQTPATVAFLNGELDALVFASAPEALMVQMLLQTPGVKLMDFPQSEAYSRRLAFLTPVVLPRGVVDLAADMPPQNVRLVASTTTLLARDGTHPALLQLFSQDGKTLHGGAGWFNRARDFPKITQGEFPMAAEADRFLRNGPPLLQRYLPFWMANLVERMWLALGIIVAVLLPLSKIVPPLYQFRIRSRVFRWYAQLRNIENRLEEEPASAPDLLKELDQLEQRVSKIIVPLSYTDEQYTLLGNIRMVRDKLHNAPTNLDAPEQTVKIA